MSDKPNLYDILGVARGATQDEIKEAFRAKAKAMHPDAGGDAEEFMAVKMAYQLLSDPEMRAAYDRDGQFQEKNKLERLAQDAIDAALMQVIEACPDTGRNCFLEQVRVVLDAQLGEATRRVVDASCAANRFKKAAARLTVGGKPIADTDFGRALLARAEGMDKMADSLEVNAKAIQLAIKKLADYGYAYHEGDNFGCTLYGAAPVPWPFGQANQTNKKGKTR